MSERDVRRFAARADASTGGVIAGAVTGGPWRAGHAAGLLLAAVAGTAAQAPPPTLTVPPASAHAAPGVSFEDVTTRAGLGAFRHVVGSPDKSYIIEALGSGVALIDFDDDGRLDIYLVNGWTLDHGDGTASTRPPACSATRQRHVRERHRRAGVANERWGQGVCAGDVDNDGRQDLYVTNYGINRLYRQTADGTFGDVAGAAGVAVEGWSTGCAFGDFDRDGWLDLYVAGYVALDPASPAAGPGRDPTATAPAATAPRRHRARMARGASFAGGAASCTYRSEPVMCGPGGPARRGRSPVPQQRRRHLPRGHEGGRRRGRAAPVRFRCRLVRHRRRWLAGPAGRQRLGAESRVPQSRGRPLRGRQLPVRRRASMAMAAARRTWASRRRLRQRRPRRHPHHQLRRRLQRALPQPRWRHVQRRQLRRGRGATVDSVPGVGHRVHRLRQRRLAGSARRERPCLSRRPIGCPGTLHTRSARCCSGTCAARASRRLGARRARR